VRELAIELAPLVRVNGVAPATVVQGSAMFRAIESSVRSRNTTFRTRKLRRRIHS
jgi:NAD(P)-dependent dehydrogenase (short-subunit alcohol dehydrogenase family)